MVNVVDYDLYQSRMRKAFYIESMTNLFTETQTRFRSALIIEYLRTFRSITEFKISIFHRTYSHHFPYAQ